MIKKLVALTAVLLFIGNASASIPDISDTDITPKFVDDTGQGSEQIEFSATYSGDDNLETVGVKIRDPFGNVIRNVNGTPANNQISPTFQQQLLSVGEAGEYEAEFYAVDAGLEYSEYKTFYYKEDEPSPDFTLLGPSDGETIDYSPSQTGANIDFSTDIDPKSSGEVELFIDFQDGNGFSSYYSEQVSSGTQNVDTTELISEGEDFQYLWRYTRDSTGNDFNSNVRTFSVNELDSPPNVEDMQFTPSDPDLDETVSVDITFSDDVGLDSFIYQVQNPSGTIISDTQGPISGTTDTITISQGFTPSQSGEYTVFVTATDTKGQKDGLTEKVDVGSVDSDPNINDVTLSKDEVKEGEPVEITANLNDDKELAFYSIDILKNGALVVDGQIDDGLLSTSSKTVSGTWTPSDSGQYTVQVRTFDSADQETVKTLDVNVIPEKEPADFILNNPDGNSTIAYGPSESFANVDFRYRVEAPWDGSGNLVVTGEGINGEVNIPFSHTKRFSNISSSQTLTEGGLEYKVEITRDGTNRTYTSKEKQFAVVQTSEPVPEATFNKPEKQLPSSKIFNPVNIDVGVDSNIDSTTTVSLKYPSNFSEVLAQRDTSNQVTSFDLTENLDNVEKTAGEYTVEVRTDSETTGNTYLETYDFTVNQNPVFDVVSPNGETIILDDVGLKTQNTEFSANLDNVLPGTVKYQIRSPTETKFKTIAEKTVTEAKENVSLDFDYNVGLEFAGETDTGRSFTDSYNSRIKYVPGEGEGIVEDVLDFIDGEGQAFVSEINGFSYKEPKLSLFDRVERGITDTLGPQGLFIAAIIISIFAAAYVGILVENGAVALAAYVTVGLTFVFLGWTPIPPAVTGFLGVMLLVGLILYLADGIGGVIS
jgi:hypothetical protein